MEILDQKQQGDVLLMKVSELPTDAVEDPTKLRDAHRGLVLAEGEHTGHFHGFDLGGKDIAVLERTEKNRQGEEIKATYLNVKTPDTLTHQEHGAVKVDAGIWRLANVMEVDPLTNCRSRVQD